jgi:hexokinase
MQVLQGELNKIDAAFDITKYQMEQLSFSFYNDMKNRKTLKMLPTYMYCPEKINKGEYLALDFGGTNIRISLYEFLDNNKIHLKNFEKFSLRGEDFDFTTEEYELKDIFRMVAQKIKNIIQKDKLYFLGHTFSFATNSISKDKATLISFSKGFKLKNAIGKDINDVLKEAFIEEGLNNIEPVSILNDTTATLLAGNFVDKDTDIACIVGTGHNICFKDRDNLIINTECGSFNDGIPVNGYDIIFLDKIPSEKSNLMDVLIGGKYLGRLAEELINILADQNLITPIKGISAKMLSDSICGIYAEEYTEEQKRVIKQLAKLFLKGRQN